MCKELGIKHSVTRSYDPQTNGLDERTNQTLKQRLAKLVNENQDDWDEFLEEVAYSMRTQQQSTTRFTPFKLMFGRDPKCVSKVGLCNINRPYQLSHTI